MKFVGNKAKNGGALHIISFGQIKMFSGASLTFEKMRDGKFHAHTIILILSIIYRVIGVSLSKPHYTIWPLEMVP